MTVSAVAPASGLSSSAAAVRLQEDGPNVLPSPKDPSWIRALARQMSHFFAVMLWVAAGLAVLAGTPQLAVAIAVVVVVNGVFAFVQEFRADQAGKRLRDLLPAQVTVIRDNRRQVVTASALVRGDLIVLEAGDRVCADLRLQEVHSVSVDESMLTGESVPIRPEVGGSAWAGTFVVEGEALGMVQEIGAGTQLAGIAQLAHSARPPLSPLANQLHRVVRFVAILGIVAGASFFALALQLGMPPGDGFLFAIGVTVALVPEGLLPTVTLSLARASQRMASEHALVRRLEAVETLGSTTFICTDKTGTITRNQMSAIQVWTPASSLVVNGTGYEPRAHLSGPAGSIHDLAISALLCSRGRARERDGAWVAIGDPMEAALHVLAMRAGLDTDAVEAEHPVTSRFPFDPRRRRESVVSSGVLHVKGAPDSVLPLCRNVPGAEAAVHSLSHQGLRVLAVARRTGVLGVPQQTVEEHLELLGLVGLEDPPRAGVEAAIAACRRADIRIALVTGDHPGTARAIAAQVGIIAQDGPVLEGRDMPRDDSELARLINRDVVLGD
jgi:magnesium-transporting ATPase (P-type)